MTAETTTLDQPIDAMYLIHKALRGEANRTVEPARCLEYGCSLQPFKLAFTAWATVIMYHAEKEFGTEMTKSIDETRRAAAHDPIEWVKWAVFEKEDDEYSRLLEGVMGVMTVLEEDIGANQLDLLHQTAPVRPGDRPSRSPGRPPGNRRGDGPTSPQSVNWKSWAAS